MHRCLGVADGLFANQSMYLPTSMYRYTPNNIKEKYYLHVIEEEFSPAQ